MVITTGNVNAMDPIMNDNHYHNEECCHMQPPHQHHHYKTSGKMIENEFRLINGNPYLCDNTNVQYGMNLSVSENVYTQVSRRRADTCIDLSATIDMTESMNTNTALNHFIEQVIANKFETLDGILPVTKSNTEFKLYYTILDGNDNIITEAYASITAQDMKYHSTDIRDYRVYSCNQIFIVNIPAMDYQGLYTLRIDRIVAMKSYINTSSHITDGLNPYYQFTSNNTKIALQHDVIEEQEHDGTVILSSTDINYVTTFQANLTTRLKFSFTAYMSEFIATDNTFNVWSSLYEPTDAIIARLNEEVTQLQEANVSLTQRVTALENKTDPIVKYEQNTEYKIGQLVYLSLGTIYQATENFTSNNDVEKSTEQSLTADVDDGKLLLIISSVTNNTEEEPAKDSSIE